jgi:hypothetical protein
MSPKTYSDEKPRRTTRSKKFVEQKRAQEEDFIQRSTPRQINLELMKSYDDSWGDLLPECGFRAIGRCLLIISQLETHDPLVLRRATGYPLNFLCSLIHLLLHNKTWKGFGGYVELIHCIDEYPQYGESTMELLLSIVQDLFNDPYKNVVDPWFAYQQSLVAIDYQRPILTAFSM